jgi:hypothetical protein
MDNAIAAIALVSICYQSFFKLNSWLRLQGKSGNGELPEATNLQISM